MRMRSLPDAMCLGWHHNPSEMGPTVSLTVMWGVRNVSSGNRRSSSHVESSCCPRTLTNTRWLPSCRTDEVDISPIVMVALTLLSAGSTVYKVLTFLLQCSFYFSKKISQNTGKLVFSSSKHEVLGSGQVTRVRVPAASQIPLTISSQSCLRNTFSTMDTL